MKAYGFTDYGDSDMQEFLDVEAPTPMAGELLIEVKAAAVNPVDWKIRAGHLRDFQVIELPAVLGSEAAGVVRGVGQDVEGFAVGDEVFGNTAPGSGGYAEYTLLIAECTAHKPSHMSFVDASTLSVAAATAYDGVTPLELKPGMTLLINGISGGVGIAAAQIARDLGINVIGTASADKQPLIETLGAILIPYGEGVEGRVRQIMPDGVDAILDLAGGDALRAVAGLLRDRSKLISAGDQETVESLGGQLIVRDRTSRVLDIVAAMVETGKLDPHVQDVLPLDKAADALTAVETGHAKGKVVIQVA
jgi:NADPH:quinone reductase-like Zn-dependent oxidoreductase